MSIDITTLVLAKEYTNRMVGSGGTGGGVNGKDGITPHIGDNGNWFIGTVDTGVSAQGPAGENGVTPHIGTNGNWYIGSVNTGVSAKGVKGDNGLDGNGIKSAILNSDYTLTLTFDDGTTYTTPSIRGATGDAGSAGKNGTDGKDGSDGVGIASIKQTTTSTADGGNNVFTVTLTNGTTATFIVKNGSKGSTGKDGSNGVDGGHYTPVVTQPTTDTMQISFAPSKSDMPAVNPVTVNLPVSENSGQNLELDTTLTQSGKAADAKATGVKLAELESKIPGPGVKSYGDLSGKPSINGVTLEGDKTAEELGIGQPTNEQVSTAVSDYLAEHPVTSGATEEEAAAIQRFENIGFSDPLAYGNLLDTATMMLNNIGTPKAGVNVFDLAANWNPEGAWKFMFFPVEAGGKFTVVSTKLPAMSEFLAVSRDGIVLEGVPTVGRNPWAVTADSSKGVSYQTLTISDDWPADGYYLMLQLGYGTGNTDFDTLIVFRGEYADYQGYAPYNPDLGTSKSPRLRVTPENLTDDLLNRLNRGNTAVQAEDLKAAAYPWSTELPGAHFGFPVLNASAIGDFAKLCNSARICAADNNHLRLNTTYAHCPTIKIIDGIVYAVAFQNARNVDTLSGASIELFRAHIADWTVLDQTNVASAGLACGAETLTDGAIDPNMLYIDGKLRITFTTKFADGGHRQCYRDYDIATGTFGDIGLCKITDGMTVYDFDIPGIKAACGDFTAANPQIYMATQYATFNGEHYIALAAGSGYKDAPILKTTDFITFTYWATPVVDGADMEYECALVACRTSWGQDFLYSATRQHKDAFNEDSRRMLISRIALTDGSVIRSVWVPDGNIRPFWHTKGETAFLWHTLETNRSCSTITSFPFNTNTLLPDSIGTVADTAAMIYATAEAYENDLIVCYMRKGGLYISRIPPVSQYNYADVVPMLEKFLDYFGTK